MIYANDDNEAIMAMERHRTGNYGENSLIRRRRRYDGYGEFGRYDAYASAEDTACPNCGAERPDMFYMNDDDECVGCSECVYPSEVLY